MVSERYTARNDIAIDGGSISIGDEDHATGPSHTEVSVSANKGMYNSIKIDIPTNELKEDMAVYIELDDDAVEKLSEILSMLDSGVRYVEDYDEGLLGVAGITGDEGP